MIPDSEMTRKELLVEIEELKKKLEETEETLSAIRQGQVDALIVHTDMGDQVFTLKGAELTYRIIFEQMNDGAATFTGEGVILFCNESLSETLGIPLEKIVGTRIQDLIASGSRSGFERMLRESREGSCSGEVDLNVLAGVQIPMLISMNSILTGDTPCYCMVATDLTERKRAEESLRRAYEDLELKVEERTAALTRSNEELQQFAYVASHDLQEPLRMISGYLELLAKEYKGRQLDREAENYIDFAVEGTRRMHDFIQDLLLYSRVTSKAKRSEPTQMEKVLSVTLSNIGPSMDEASAVVTHDSLPTIVADNLQMIELLQNLMTNAIKFHGSGAPRIHVSCERKGTDWVFSVRDNGIGIAPEHLGRIFEMFKRLHPRDKYPGTGIGLTICRKIVERHGGRIWVESTVGQGSTFFFTIPVEGAE